jgi:hypothetical protein
MSKSSNISKGDTSLEKPQEVVGRPITPRNLGEDIRFSSPSGAYQVSDRALERIERVEARAARVFATAARFAFR